MTSTYRFGLGALLFQGSEGNQVKKNIMGRYQVTLASAIYSGFDVFTRAAAIGHAMPDRIDYLVNLIDPGMGSVEANPELVQRIKTELDKLLELLEGEAESLSYFWFFTHFPMAHSPDIRSMKQMEQEKMSLDDALQSMGWYAAEGLVFGATYPRFAELWRQNFEETQNEEMLAFARTYHINVPRQAPLSLAEAEITYTRGLVEYVKEVFPELLEPLRLG